MNWEQLFLIIVAQGLIQIAQAGFRHILHRDQLEEMRKQTKILQKLTDELTPKG